MLGLDKNHDDYFKLTGRKKSENCECVYSHGFDGCCDNCEKLRQEWKTQSFRTGDNIYTIHSLWSNFYYVVLIHHR